jgi:succinoglycan biosynthesis transport protein ExoP
MSTGFDQPSLERYGEEEGGGLPEFLLDPIGVTHRRWLPMALCVAAGLVVTIVALIAWKPIYSATSTILITSQQIPKDFVRSTVEEDSLANINAMIGEVLSAEHLSKLIDSHNLFPKRAGTAARIDLVNYMRSRISSAPQSRPGERSQSIVYEISYESGDPEEAATVSNALAALFVEASVERRNSQAKRTTVFLRGALERTEKELREQSNQVTEFRQSHRGELPDEQETSLRRLELLSTHRESLAQQITAKEDRIISISSHGSGASENDALIDDLRRQLAREIAIHTDEHPNVIALRERLKRLKESNQKSPLPPSTSRMVEDERREIARMREQRDRIDTELADLNARIEQIPRVAEELAALQQKETVLRDDYTAGLRKVEAAELAENLESARQGGQVSILDNAAIPSSPKMPRWMVMLGGIGASLGLAVAVAVLLELIDPVVIGASQVTKLSSRPVLGTVPFVN